MLKDKLIVHCSATPPGMDIGVREIREWHLKRGFSDIGYHRVIRRSGLVEQGRPLHKSGAHAKGYNQYLGVCLVGGVDDAGKPSANFTPEQLHALLDETAHLKSSGRLDSNADICGHRDLPGVAKECPCIDVRALFSQVPA